MADKLNVIYVIFSEFCISKIIKINTKILRTTEMDGDRFRVRELSMSKWFFVIFTSASLAGMMF